VAFDCSTTTRGHSAGHAYKAPDPASARYVMPPVRLGELAAEAVSLTDMANRFAIEFNWDPAHQRSSDGPTFLRAV
jgi:hypothetical protein